MNNTTKTFRITKLEAAHRQLKSAIRLFFIDEDELAVHTVASAAYRLISDLKKKQGQSEPADFYLISLFYIIRDFRNGTLPTYITENPELMDWVANLSSQFPIEVDLSIEDITASIDKATEASFWKTQNKTSNFLKHADHDAEDRLGVNVIGNLQLLMQAYAALTDLIENDLNSEPEGFVLWLYSSVESGDSDSLPSEYQSIGEQLLKLQGNERRLMCATLIRERREEQSLHESSQY